MRETEKQTERQRETETERDRQTKRERENTLLHEMWGEGGGEGAERIKRRS